VLYALLHKDGVDTILIYNQTMINKMDPFYLCTDCTKKYKTSKKLIQHAKEIHSKDIADVPEAKVIPNKKVEREKLKEIEKEKKEQEIKNYETARASALTQQLLASEQKFILEQMTRQETTRLENERIRLENEKKRLEDEKHTI